MRETILQQAARQEMTPMVVRIKMIFINTTTTFITRVKVCLFKMTMQKKSACLKLRGSKSLLTKITRQQIFVCFCLHYHSRETP